ncbi:MAG: peptide-methionine (R)-S-oxide reductase MsrB [Nitrosopumilaceae archaeon]
MSSDEIVSKTDEEWKKILTPEQYRVCRKKETESPFTGKYNDCKENGMYKCSCCGNDLFDSNSKFESGTGWPSFFKPINDENIKCESDTDYGMIRTEVMCKKCGAHLGHVFDDGPQPTNLRFCINSVSLNLDKKNE